MMTFNYHILYKKKKRDNIVEMNVKTEILLNVIRNRNTELQQIIEQKSNPVKALYL